MAFFDRLLGKDLAAVLDGRGIKATGRLSLYKGSIEVTLDDPAKLLIVGPAGQTQ